MIIFSLIFSSVAVVLSILGYLNSLKALKMAQNVSKEAEALKKEFENLTWDKF